MKFCTNNAMESQSKDTMNALETLLQGCSVESMEVMAKNGMELDGKTVIEAPAGFYGVCVSRPR